MSAIAAALGFLLEHLDLIGAIADALEGGATKEEIKKAIRATQVAAADAQMKIELGE